MSRDSRWVVGLEEAGGLVAANVGVVARELAALRGAGLPVMDGLVITTGAYREFVDANDLSAVAAAEFSATSHGDYERAWESSLRILAAFRRAHWPRELRARLAGELEGIRSWGQMALVPSPACPGSTALWSPGLHEAVLGVHGTEEALDAIVDVWASLFSAVALLYSEELGLDSDVSAMAVLVQPLVAASRGGTALAGGSTGAGVGLVEAAWGLPDGLTSGSVEPDSWIISRENGAVIDHTEPARALALEPGNGGTRLEHLDPARSLCPPLDADGLEDVWQLAEAAERALGATRQIEWQHSDGGLLVTRVHPASNLAPDDRAEAVLAIAPTEKLHAVRIQIEDEILPAMWSEANALAVVDLKAMTDAQLVEEAGRRTEAVGHWRLVRRTGLRPFAHGARAFGRFYYDLMRSEDPLEFRTLLARTPEEFAAHAQLLAEIGAAPTAAAMDVQERERLEAEFLARAAGSSRKRAAELLELGRASWRVGQDEELYLARIELEATRVLDEIESRLNAPAGAAASVAGPASRAELSSAVAALRGLCPMASVDAHTGG